MKLNKLICQKIKIKVTKILKQQKIKLAKHKSKNNKEYF